jgi:hypothetical protein
VDPGVEGDCLEQQLERVAKRAAGAALVPHPAARCLNNTALQCS